MFHVLADAAYLVLGALRLSFYLIPGLLMSQALHQPWLYFLPWLVLWRLTSLLARVDDTQPILTSIPAMLLFSGYLFGASYWLSEPLIQILHVPATLAWVIVITAAIIYPWLWHLPLCLLRRASPPYLLLSLPTTYLFVIPLIDWLHTQLFWGLPWTLLSYSQIQGPLHILIPIVGSTWLGSVLYAIVWSWFMLTRFGQTLPLAILLTLYLLTYYSLPTSPAALPTKQISIVQGGINHSLEQYWQLSQSLPHGLIIWPEGVCRIHQHEYSTLRHHQLLGPGKTLWSGCRFEDKHTTYNSLVSFGDGGFLYHKQHLVPFGEYLPLSRILSPLIAPEWLAELNYRHRPVSTEQLLQYQGMTVIPQICYDVFYPTQPHLLHGQLMLVIANNSWYGQGSHREQFQQIARYRAMEIGRGVVIVSHDGPSGWIDANGSLPDTAQLDTQISAGKTITVTPYQGETPFVQRRLLLYSILQAWYK